MAYPRRCPLCSQPYGEAGAQIAGQVTARSEPGGTPSPWRRGVAGRLLLLLCVTCGEEYPWDYFADAKRDPPGQRPAAVAPDLRPAVLTQPGRWAEQLGAHRELADVLGKMLGWEPRPA